VADFDKRFIRSERNKITVEELYKERYKTGATPWGIGKPDFNLIETVNKTPIKPCKALDIECGKRGSVREFRNAVAPLPKRTKI
jgi:hypothetical protein